MFKICGIIEISKIEFFIRKIIEYSLKIIPVKTMFSLTALEVLLFEYRLVLGSVQVVPGSERVKSDWVKTHFIFVHLVYLNCRSLTYFDSTRITLSSTYQKKEPQKGKLKKLLFQRAWKLNCFNLSCWDQFTSFRSFILAEDRNWAYLYMWCFERFGVFCSIWKTWKHPWRSVTFSKVSSFIL